MREAEKLRLLEMQLLMNTSGPPVASHRVSGKKLLRLILSFFSGLFLLSRVDLWLNDVISRKLRDNFFSTKQQSRRYQRCAQHM